MCFDDRTTPRTSPHDERSPPPTAAPKQPARRHGNMAGFRISKKPPAPIAAPSSDYGSDFDDDTVTELLSQADQYSQPAGPPTLASETLQQQDPVVQDAPPTLQRSIVLKRPIEQSDSNVPSRVVREPQVEIEYSESNRTTFSRTLRFLKFVSSLQADTADTAPHSRTALP